MPAGCISKGYFISKLILEVDAHANQYKPQVPAGVNFHQLDTLVPPAPSLRNISSPPGRPLMAPFSPSPSLQGHYHSDFWLHGLLFLSLILYRWNQKIYYLWCLVFPTQHSIRLILVIMCSYRLFPWWCVIPSCGYTQFIYAFSIGGEGVNQVERGNNQCKGPEVGTCLVQRAACGWRGAGRVGRWVRRGADDASRGPQWGLLLSL